MSRGGGIGESKVTSTASPEEFERFDDGLPDRSAWTWGGKTADEVANSHLLPWESTDQSIAMRVAAQMEREFERGGRLAVGRDAEDKSIEARQDAFKSTGDPLSMVAYDAKKYIADEHRKPGFVQMYAPKDEAQTFTGPGAFRVVEDGQGQPVHWKNQVLLERPTDIQQAENVRDENRARNLLTQKASEQRESMQRSASRANVPLSAIKDEDFGLSADTL